MSIEIFQEREGHEPPAHGPADTRVNAFEQDRATVDAVRQGDEGAFKVLLERHQGSMLRFARANVGNLAVAEEVVQDTWLEHRTV